MGKLFFNELTKIYPMVDYEKPTERPQIGVFYGFDHVTFHVGNAK